MSLFEPIIFFAAMVALTDYYRRGLFTGEDDFSGRWLIKWIAVGVVLPVAAWVMLNAGTRPILPALIPVPLPSGAGWFGMLVYHVRYVATQTSPALFVISSFWAATSLGWYITVMGQGAQNRREFVTSCAAWCALLLPLVALMYFWFGPAFLGLAALFWVWPLAHFALSLSPAPSPPIYARAVAKMKFGKYREAEQAIIGELEKCESDFDGWIMLAALYARQFHDLPEAERTIREICDAPEATPSHIAVALNLLADWQLEVNGDPVAARLALDEIVRRLPNTHLAHMAMLRAKQLPATEMEWKKKQHAKTFTLPPLSEHLSDHDAGGGQTHNRSEAQALAARCIEKLKQDPNDVEVREELAAIFADQLGEVDLAVDQIKLLMEMPNQSAAKLPGWLALMAGWELRRGTNLEAAHTYLRRLIREHPGTVQAFAAQRRLSLLDADDRIARAGATVHEPLSTPQPD